MAQKRFHMDGGFTTNGSSVIDGNLSVTQSPTSTGHVTPKSYVDAAVAGASSPGGRADFIASGTLPNGTPVILKADGTVEAVGITSTTVVSPMSTGAETLFNAGSTVDGSISFDPNTAGKFVIVYRDQGNSNYGTAIVGTVSGTTITFGTGVVFSSSDIRFPEITFDPNTAAVTAGKFIVAYQDGGNSDYGTAIVGTVSGTSISFGTELVFNSGNTDNISIAFDPNTVGKFIVAYKDNGNSYYGTAIVGTVSGTTLSFGTEVVFNSGSIGYISISFDPSTAGKFVIAYNDVDNGNYGTAIAGTLSGTTVTFGTEVVFNSSNTSYTSIAFDLNNAGKFVIAYRDVDNSGYGMAIVGTLSGTTMTFGTAVAFNSSYTNYISLSFDPNTAGKFIVVYRDQSNSDYGTAIVGTVSGTSISFGTEVVFYSGSVYHISLSFDPNTAGKFVIAYTDGGNSNYGTVVLGEMEELATNTNLTADNFIGTSTDVYTDAETATVTLQGGVSTNQSGLVVNATYYVQEDGTLATIADTISVIAGKALSATSLFLSPPVYDSTAIDAAAVALNTAKISNVDHPLVETAVPVGALFTDTVYDATALAAAVALNTAKVSNSTNASDLASGTLQDSLFPAVLPAVSGANLTDLPSTGPTPWVVITADVTVVAGSRNLVDTTNAPVTITLPISPTLGHEVMIIDASGTTETNNIVIDSNGENIQGQAENLIISVNRAAFQVVYYNSTNGWVFMEV
jgi:hypothetical protein